MRRLEEKLREKVEVVLKSMKENYMLRGLEIEENKPKIIRIFVDKPGGVTIQDCAKISERISIHFRLSPELENEDYRLEVSSPGIEEEEGK
ncbi:MAG: hypothetical protein ABIN61_07200 [candidate division WOR-3 bacterium]